MLLKEYQVSTLQRLEEFLTVLTSKEQETKENFAFLKSQGKSFSFIPDHCVATWKELQLKRILPTDNEWIIRKDGLERDIPSICLKIPTGGGKTLLATEAIALISSQYLKKQTGFVLWIVPSEAIYRQTLKRFKDRQDPYRQSLERASGGRTKILEKFDLFTPEDVSSSLCVMILMLQSSARKSKDQLKLFKDSSGFMNFFPEIDTPDRNRQLLQQIPNLDIYDLADDITFQFSGPLIKQSLGNTLRLLNPVVIIDEGHKAYSEIAKKTINQFNPSFVLELSATPNATEKQSNILVNISGTDLKKEQMLKLPISLEDLERGDWKSTLSNACQKLDQLKADANNLHKKEGRYIRPIMLIRVDRTGKDTATKELVHSDDVVTCLQKLGYPREEIKLKTASVDELEDEDLLSQYTKTRFIITKDALREGWDCPFAYILTSLSKTTAKVTLTQMVGRILRQPDAALTRISSLDQCYIFTFDQNVNDVFESIKSGLSEEGLSDLAKEVRIADPSSKKGAPQKRKKIDRQKTFQNETIFLPKILKKHKNSWRLFDYERDILSIIDWSKISFNDIKSPSDLFQSIKKTLASIDVSKNQMEFSFQYLQSEIINGNTQIEVSYLARQLLDVIPNPWQASRIIEEALDNCYKMGRTPEDLFPIRLDLANSIKLHVISQLEQESETIFKTMLKSGEIQFQLTNSYKESLDWLVPNSFEIDSYEEDRPLKNRGKSLEKGLFDTYDRSTFNSLEENVALYLDDESAIRWWHRLIARRDTEYFISGWQKQKIYPDFLICMKKNPKNGMDYCVIEVKGSHLAGNADTEYKQKLFNLLNKYQENIIEAGEFIKDDIKGSVKFKMLMQDQWKQDIAELLKEWKPAA